VIVGTYKDAGGHVHGFLYNGGSFQPIDVPGATDTAALGINDAGIIVGTYKDSSGAIHGFAADNHGSFVQPIDAPPSGGIPNDAFLWDINNTMQFVGALEPRGSGVLATMVDFAPNLIQNGSFEQGPNPSDYLPLSPGSTAITGWTVIRGAIDYVGSYFVASDGSRCLDLNGNPGVGGVAQTFATVPGQTYQVSFDMAGNSDLSNTLQTMEVSAASQVQDFTFVSGSDKTHLGWQRDTWTFTANASQTTLEFYSLQTANPYYGPMLDNVMVAPIL